MDLEDPTACASFRPLASVVALDGAPSEVEALLTGRWMAELGTRGVDSPTFRLRWRRVPGAGEGEPPVPDEVRWEPECEGGRLRNCAGRVVVVPGADAATVELEPRAFSHNSSFEPLVEAALGHALAARGECFLHAAAFELDARRLLVVGGSASGKSTLAAAAAACGGRVISDDSLLLGLTEGRPLVRGARRNVWLRPGSAALATALERRGLPTAASGDRIRLDRSRAPSAFRLSTRPDCMALLRRAPGTDPGVVSRRLSQADGLTALLQSTSSLYLTDRRFDRRRRSLFELMTTFAEVLPAIELRVGTDLLDAPEDSLAAILASLP